MKIKIFALTLLILSTISCVRTNTVTYKETYSARTIYSGLEGVVYAVCDDVTGNLIYFANSKMAVVPNGCTKK